MTFHVYRAVSPATTGHSSVRTVGLAGGIQPQRTVGLHHVAMRAHPCRLTAAGSEAPLTGDAIAARHGDRLRLVRRSPGDDGARIGEDRAHRLGRQERRDQRRAVGDEDVPADRAVVAADLLDRAQIHPWFQLVAIDRARQQHAAQPRGVQLRQQRFGNALRALDRIGGGLDRGTKFARAGDGVGRGWCDEVHAALAARGARAVNLARRRHTRGRTCRTGRVRAPRCVSQ